MSDDELLAFLGFDERAFATPEDRARVLASIAEKRALFERMASLTVELPLYEQGLAPKPRGVLMDRNRSKRRPV